MMGDLPLALPLLTADEEADLARKVEAGVAASAVLDGFELRVDGSRAELERIADEGDQARQRFLLSNLRLVSFATSGATRQDPGLSRDEVFQEGVAAMADALRRYDWRRGRFSTLALATIRWKLDEYAASRGGSLGVPAWRALEIRRARSIAARLESESGRRAQVSAVAAELGRDQSSTASLLRHQPPLSIDAMAPRAQERTLAEAPVSGPADDVRADLRRLPKDQREAITLRFGLADGRPRSWLEVAELTGTSVSTVRRVCKRGLTALRNVAAETAADETEAAALARARATTGKLGEVDRLSKAGLSLVEVAIAMKMEPAEVHDACLAGHRQDLLARFGRLEQTYGFEPGALTAPFVVETKESARRRERFREAAAALNEPPTSVPRTLHEDMAPLAAMRPLRDSPRPRPGRGRGIGW